MIKVNSITCASWVPQGAAKQDPIKAEIDKEELSKVIEETKENLDECENNIEEHKEVDEEKYDKIEDEVLKEDLVSPTSKKKKKKRRNRDFNDELIPHTIEEIYGLQEKDEGTEEQSALISDEKDDLNLLDKLGCLTMYSSPHEDPLIQIKEDDDVSECENNRICSTDNMIALGHVDGDAAILEVYVYNQIERSFYVHHEILLPAIPLCTEWLNTDPAAEGNKPGNLIAIGTMSSVIDVYDLDIVNVLEPSFRLGKEPRKKKKIAGTGHKDAVISLSWNRDMEHILASGSADQTVLLWDLHSCEPAQTLSSFKGEVQALSWHPKDSHCLLTGACDKYIRLFDCRTEDSYKKWKLNGEIESLTWDVGGSNPYQFIASTSEGFIYCIDVRNTKPLWDVKGHQGACTGVAMSSTCPGCLVTVSDDEDVKIWDISGDKASLILTKNPSLGVIHCISPCPDDPFVFCLGGDDGSNNLKVWDLQCYKKVRQQFCPRVGFPVRDDEADESDDDSSDDEKESDHEDEEVSDGPEDKMEVEDEKENTFEGKGRKSLKKLKSKEGTLDMNGSGSTTSESVKKSNPMEGTMDMDGPKPSTSESRKAWKPKNFKKKKGGYFNNKRK